MSEAKNLGCKNCGANLNFDPAQVSMNCAFCGSTFFMEIPETEEDKKLRQDAEIITFKVTKEDAKQKFSEWIKKGLLKPSNLTSTFKEKEFEGVYVPFFKVRADANTSWRGRDKIVIREAANNEPAEYEYIDRNGSHSDTYKDFITATKGLPQSEVDSIIDEKKIDDNDTKPFNQQLMMGFKIENPAVKEENAVDMAKERIKDKERDACRSGVNELLDTDTMISNIQTKLMMLPIWILVYMYENKPFRVLINGQTGITSGQKPVSKFKVIIAIVIAAAIIAGIYFVTKKK